ncbi:MAG: PAS domain S-box protein [Deltaproteobacteria bacterium]|nr:PAS domain S-box protein [Deltaproteobacteria bacterium]
MSKKSSLKNPGTQIKDLQKEIEQLKAELAVLRLSEARFRSLLENVPNLITIVDRKGILQYINRPVRGLTKEEICGMNIFDEVQPEFSNDLEKAMKQVFEKGEGSNYQALSADTDRFNHNRWFDNHVGPVKEKGKVAAMALITTDISARVEAEENLRKMHDDLENLVKERTHNLEETNTALRVLLKKREEDKSAMEENVLANIKELVFPYLDKLNQSRLGDDSRTYLNILRENLEDIIAPFTIKLTSKYMGLTPAELQVANLVKLGKTSKEIAALLHMSSKTIDTHRYNTRKKIGLKDKKGNLRAYLLSID